MEMKNVIDEVLEVENVVVENVAENVIEDVAEEVVVDVMDEQTDVVQEPEKPIKKVVTKFTTEKKEVIRIEMPSKNDEGKYEETAIFSKEQFAQMLADAGMEKRSAVGQSSIFYKGDSPDTKVASRTGKEIVKKYLLSRSTVREQILSQFVGITEDDIKENVKSQKLVDWVEPIKMALLVDPELDAMLQDGEDAGKTMQERVATSQKGKIAKLCGVPSEKRNEISNEVLAAHLKTMTSKYGLAAICGIKYKNISPQEVISMIKKRAK